MSISDILAQIDAEIATLQQARAALAGAPTSSAVKKPGRPAKATPKPKKKRKMSPERRARLVAAVKARWAAQKKSSTK
jgi:hypothetical protein